MHRWGCFSSSCRKQNGHQGALKPLRWFSSVDGWGLYVDHGVFFLCTLVYCATETADWNVTIRQNNYFCGKRHFSPYSVVFPKRVSLAFPLPSRGNQLLYHILTLIPQECTTIMVRLSSYRCPTYVITSYSTSHPFSPKCVCV